MERHIIFFDIDGTIIDEKTGIIPESTKEAIRKAGENGHILFINTGRCQAIWPEEILNLGFHGVIGGCGTHIVYEGKELFHRILPKDLCEEIRDDLLTWHIDGVLEGRDCTYFRKDRFYPVVEDIYEKGIYRSSNLKYWDDENIIYDKMALWHDESSRMDLFREKYSSRFSFIQRDPNFYEVVPEGLSKATGMDWIINYLGIPRENTVAVGDSANDIPMFEYAETTIGIKSDKTDVLKLVDIVTDTVLEDGVCHGLQKIGLI